jgi:hypothetical protein
MGLMQLVSCPQYLRYSQQESERTIALHFVCLAIPTSLKMSQFGRTNTLNSRRLPQRVPKTKTVSSFKVLITHKTK